MEAVPLIRMRVVILTLCSSSSLATAKRICLGVINWRERGKGREGGEREGRGGEGGGGREERGKVG